MLPVSGLAQSASATSPTDLAAAYGSWTGIRANHVVGPTGAFKDKSGSSRGLSNQSDLSLMLAMRKFADLLLVDAKTAREERYRGSADLLLGIISRTGNFQGIPAISNPRASVVLFAPTFNFGNGIEKAAVTTVPITQVNPFPEIMNWAKSSGVEAILLEAGPTLTSLAFLDDLINQSAISQTGLVDAANSPPANPFSSNFELVSLAIEPGSQYSLWRR